MSRPLKPATFKDVACVHGAIGNLRVARQLLVSAGCSEAAKRVRAALKSTEGALRHAERRARRSP